MGHGPLHMSKKHKRPTAGRRLKTDTGVLATAYRPPSWEETWWLDDLGRQDMPKGINRWWDVYSEDGD